MPNFSFSFFLTTVAAHSSRSYSSTSSTLLARVSRKNPIMSQSPSTTVPQSAFDFIDFVNASPSPFHVVESTRQILLAHGYQQLHEHQPWDGKLTNNGKYFLTRNQSSIVAFHIGGKYKPGNGITIVAAHTDSPCLKLKPNSSKCKAGYQQLGVQCYGGGLWHTWFDRDLGLAGRVMVRTGASMVKPCLIHLADPILRIPTLAIHLDRDVREAFKFNLETQLTPVLSSAVVGDVLPSTLSSAILLPQTLRQAMATHLNVAPESIVEVEACLVDTQPATVGGLVGEYVFAPRCDNVVMCFCAVRALTHARLDTNANIAMVALFDHEEVGSMSATGADSVFLPSLLQRIAQSVNKGQAWETVGAKSWLVSADMAHAVHPNYAEKHEDQHTPKLNHGVVIKYNANQRYATTAVTSTLLKLIAEKRDVPLQSFVVRNDSPCGSTVGPILASKLGIKTIDVGNPQLSMHSIREQAGALDIDHAIRLFGGCFELHAEMEAQILSD